MMRVYRIASTRQMSKEKELRGIKILIIAGIVILAVMTCPGEKAHKQAVQEAVKKECIKEGSRVKGVIEGFIASKVVTTTDCIVFSTGSLDGDLVSLGIFGKVFVIRPLIKKYI